MTPATDSGHSALEKLRRVSRRILYLVPSVVELPWGDRWIARDDVMDEHIRSGEEFERGEQQFLLRFLKPGMMVFDIGAHHGLYTLLAANKVGSSGKVVAFEPSPRERKRLTDNVRLNRYDRVVIEALALGKTTGKTTLHVCLGRETGCNSLRPPTVEEPLESLEVLVSTVDDYCAEHGIISVDFAKLDVEGAELDVLAGARQFTTGTPRPVFLVELADVRTQVWGYKSSAIYDTLASKGFRWYSVTNEGFLKPQERKESFHENLIAVPGERADAVQVFIKD